MANPRAPRLSPEQRGPLVLDAALELLASDPGRRPTMEAIARRAGVTKPSVYNCFATRDDLLSALAAREEAAIRDLVARSVVGLDRDSLEATLSGAFRAILESVVARPAGWRLVYPLISPRDEALTRRISAVREANLRMTERLCRDYLERRGQRESALEARLLARAIAGVLDQLIELVLAGDEVEPRPLAAWAARLIARGEAAL